MSKLWSKNLHSLVVEGIHDTTNSVTLPDNHFLFLPIPAGKRIAIGGDDLPFLEDIPAPPEPTLEEVKAKKVLEIDQKTQALIAAGFTFDSAQFSLSINAQMNWSALLTFQNAGQLSYPCAVTNKEDTEYQIADPTTLVQFCGAAMVAVNTPIATGRALKVSVQAASTIAEVDTVIDNR